MKPSCFPRSSDSRIQLTHLFPSHESPASTGSQSPCSLPSALSTTPDRSALQSPCSESPLPWFLLSSSKDHYANSPCPPRSPYNSFHCNFTSSPSVYSDGVDVPFCQRSTVYRCLVTVQGHHGHVSAIATFGKFVYMGFADMNSILVLEKPFLFEYTRFGYRYGSVNELLVTDDKVYSTHMDNKIRIWHRRRGRRRLKHKLVATLPTFRDYLSNFIPPSNYRQIRRHHKRLWIDHVDTVTALTLGPNGLLYSSSWDKTVKVWRLSNSRCIESIDSHDDAVNALVAGCDGLLYTGSADGTVKVWCKIPSMDKHKLVAKLEGHHSAVNALVLAADGQRLYSGGSDSFVRVWDREDSASFMLNSTSLSGHSQAILCLTVAGNLLCSGSADKTIRVWKRHGSVFHICLAVLKGHHGPVKAICASLDTKARCLVYSGSMDSTLKVWKVATGEDEDTHF